MVKPLHLFEAVGIELEYMIVADDSLSVLPVADRLLAAQAGRIVSELEMGAISWSNELVLHVIELKTNGPAKTMNGLGDGFHRQIVKINKLLATMGGCLMPTACHPWMNPLTETKLWPHEYSPIYEAYDRIFSCRGHGWSNLQSTHINLPFHGDEEFSRLHAAIRLLMPIMPALTASSPILDGKATGYLDSRMEVYRHNSEKISSIAGQIVPEPIYDRNTYERDIFQRMYKDIAPFDPEGVLQDEFLNSRGAIARFDRESIEIRVLDIQETPQADIAVAALITAVLKRLCRSSDQGLSAIRHMDTDRLSRLFLAVIQDGNEAVIDDGDYPALLGLRHTAPMTAGQIWRCLYARVMEDDVLDQAMNEPLGIILSKGCLARRISNAVGTNPGRDELYTVYEALCRCLADGIMFHG